MKGAIIFAIAMFLLCMTVHICSLGCSAEGWDPNEIRYLPGIFEETERQKAELDNVDIPGAPLVSGLCVTRKRTKMLRRAIGDFLRQSYPNKELVIVYDEDDDETRELHRMSKDDRVKFHVNVHGKVPLGALRNQAVRHARGEFVIQWDDDDEYHPDRVLYQMKHCFANGRKASTLERWLIKDDVTGKKYMSHARRRAGTEAGWEGSLLAPRNFLTGFPYPSLSKGEDSVVIQELCRRNQIESMKMPHLYTYHLHGKNTYDRDHGLRIITDALEMN